MGDGRLRRRLMQPPTVQLEQAAKQNQRAGHGSPVRHRLFRLPDIFMDDFHTHISSGLLL